MSFARASVLLGSLGLLGACPTTGGDTGTNDTNDTNTGTPGPALVALAGGSNATCAVLADGTARCWGDNRSGQLGDGSTTSSVTPVDVSGLTDAVAISTGYEFSCAIRTGGSVVCWGSGTNGHLGNGASDNSSVPVAVSGLTNAVEIRAGFSTACALRGDGTVWCWGRGGELGDSTTFSDSNVPVQVPGLTGVEHLAGASHGGTSLSSHTCGVRTDGSAFCWGLNSDGQNGNGTQDSARSPVEVTGIDDGTAIAVGMTHGCVVEGSGTSCWGSSQLVGDGTVERRFSPVPIASSAAFVELTAGFEHTCGRTAAGDVWCWGRNGGGQIGDGLELTSGDVRLEPVQADVSGVQLVAAGMFHTCAYDEDDVTWCWGRNEYGERGSGTPGSSERTSVPTPVVW